MNRCASLGLEILSSLMPRMRNTQADHIDGDGTDERKGKCIKLDKESV